MVTPRNQIVDVLHYYRLLVGDRAITGYQMRFKGIILPCPYLVEVSADVLQEFFNTLLAVFFAVLLVKWLGDPITLRNTECFCIGRIEDVMEPAHRFLEPLVLAELAGDHHRSMEEDFPIIDGVCPVLAEINDISLSSCISGIRRVGLVAGIETEIVARIIRLRG